jgi:hypothetical protein
MKKLLVLSILTVGSLMITERPADAWINAKFSIGMNWELQSANNTLLYGLWRNGQTECPQWQGGAGFQGTAQPFPYFGAAPGQQQPALAYIQPQAPASPQGGQFNTIAGWNNQNVYQPASYTPNYYTPNYYAPNYYAPNYYTVPAYWYGR